MESQTKVKVFLQEKMGLETEENIGSERKKREKKDHHSKIFKLQAV